MMKSILLLFSLIANVWSNPEFKNNNKLLEYQRLKERTEFDLEMIQATGSCSGIENYSRYLSNRNEGEPPPTLYEFMPESSLLIIDSSPTIILAPAF